MQRLAETAEAIATTTSKNEKVRVLAAYLRSTSVESAAVSAVFLSGRPFPAWEETTLQVGGRLLWMLVAEISARPEAELAAAYRRYGDLGTAAYEILRRVEREGPGVSVLEAAKAFRELAAARGTAARAFLLRQLLSRSTAIEAKYLIKIMTGEMRIGLKESLVEEAIAAAFPGDSEQAGDTAGRTRRGRPRLQQVQRANMLLGDIGETLRLAAENRLDAARMRMFHPIGFMLASPVESAGQAFDYFHHAQVEDKYDGIRAQAHASAGEVRLFSRTLDEVTDSFPELIAPLAAFPEDVILDGEILAWNFRADAPGGDDPGAGAGRALPFSALQKRLGRKTPTARIMREVPVAYVVFDVLYAGGELVIDKPLRERTDVLDQLFAASQANPRLLSERAHAHAARMRLKDAQGTLEFEPAISTANVARLGTSNGDDPQPVSAMNAFTSSAVIRSPILRADSAEHLSELFDLAQARGNEGLMIKDVASTYAPGRRGKSWLKLKRELATLDVVVTGVELGNGKRAGILSDYTFAVRDPLSSQADLPRTPAGEPLLNVGKAYSGLTDAEIANMHEWFVAHTIADNGWVRQVEPRIVLEVAFNAVMESDRHNSGFALRFPRIIRLRMDKSPEEADTLDRVREIFERQHQMPKSA